MKVISLELLECLHWLKEKEDELGREIESSSGIPLERSLVEFAEDELRKVRTLKKLVQTAEETNE